MLAYVARRVALGIAQVAIVTLATFIILRLLPQDPAAVFAGGTADGASRAMVARSLGLDKPLGGQLLSFIDGLRHGSLGVSWVTQRPVTSEIASHAPVTLQLVFAGLGVSILLGALLGYGIAASDSSNAQNRRRPLVALGKGYILAAGSQPEFWWGLVLIEIFFKLLGWFPAPFGVLGPNVAPPPSVTGFIWFDAVIAGNWAAFRDFSAHMVLPVATICSVLIGPIAKVVRESILPVMSSAYYTNLRAQGSGRWRMMRCVLRNGGAPVVMLLGVLFGPVLGGCALVETIYSIDGLARLTVHSILGADYPMAGGCVATISMLCIVGYLCADLLAGWLNPALRRASVARASAPARGGLFGWIARPLGAARLAGGVK
jgi:ABC-type dipeptide/oligopeptide/nickel transport system permease component